MMNLQSMLKLSNERTFQHKEGMSQQRIDAQIDNIRSLIAFYRQYPDLLIDDIKGPQSTFRFYMYQRIFLRICMRHRYVYATFPRAFSKSFLSMMILMLRAILYPGAHLFVTSGGKQQAASITIAKIEEICKLLPCLNAEINWDRGQSKKSRDTVQYVFKNGSTIDILAARQSSRGQRRHGGVMEQCVQIDGDMLNEVIIPTTNVDRLLPDGNYDRPEKINKSQIYITTAGFKDTFAYDKLIELLIQSIIEPDEVMIMGGTYQTPVLEGLLSEDFVQQLKLAGTYNEDSFDREYRSVWTGEVDGAFFSSEKFDKSRVLLQAEHQSSGRSNKSAYYVLGVDVGRLDCTTEICVFKVTPQPVGASIKSLVNLYSLEAEHFEDQAIKLKQIYYKYHAKKIALDTNGLGVGLLDFMVKTQTDPQTGEELPPFGVENDEDRAYKNIRGAGVQEDAIFQIKANAPLNTQAYSYTQTQMGNNKIRMLIDEQQAKIKLMQTNVGKAMSVDDRNDYLRPYVLTSILKTQMMNLVQNNDGVNIILERSSRKINKDRFSAFIYGLYYIKQQDDKANKKKRFDLSNLMLYN